MVSKLIAILKLTANTTKVFCKAEQEYQVSGFCTNQKKHFFKKNSVIFKDEMIFLHTFVANFSNFVPW